MMKCFVIMPFAISDVYENAILPACQSTDTEVLRADEIMLPGNIIKDIVGRISTSDVIIADLTGRNPNVFYELGVAHALRRHVIMICGNLDDVPFDLKPYRILPYLNNYSGIQKLRTDLELTLRELGSSSSIIPSNPVSDFLSQPTLPSTPEVPSQLPTFSDTRKAIAKLDPDQVKAIRRLLICFELRVHDPYILYDEYFFRMRELIDGEPSLSEVERAEILNEIKNYEAIEDDSKRYEATKSLLPTLRSKLLREPGTTVRKKVEDIPQEYRPVVYDYMHEIMNDSNSKLHGWWVCLEFNKILAAWRDQGAIPLLVGFILEQPNPVSNSFTQSNLSTGERILGRKAFRKLLSEQLGYDYDEEMRAWQHEKDLRRSR